MLWICTPCTAAYSPDAPRCPQCGSTDHREQGDPMPKITVHGGPTNAAAGPSITGGAWGDPPADTPAVVTHGQQEVVSDGTGTALPEVPADSYSDDSVPLEPARPDYDAMSAETLRGYLRDRQLSASGSVSKMAERLRADDTAQAEKAADES